MTVIYSLISGLMGSEFLGRFLLIGLDWFLEKKKTDRESRELAVSLAMSLRRQGVTNVVLSYSSETDADIADGLWDEQEKKERENDSK